MRKVGEPVALAAWWCEKPADNPAHSYPRHIYLALELISMQGPDRVTKSPSSPALSHFELELSHSSARCPIPVCAILFQCALSHSSPHCPTPLSVLAPKIV